MSVPDTSKQPPPRAWWRHASVWLLLSGPAIVVVASLATAFIAAHGADPVLPEDGWRKSQVLEQRAAERALTPALQARNHAATPTAEPR